MREAARRERRRGVRGGAARRRGARAGARCGRHGRGCAGGCAQRCCGCTHRTRRREARAQPASQREARGARVVVSGRGRRREECPHGQRAWRMQVLVTPRVAAPARVFFVMRDGLVECRSKWALLGAASARAWLRLRGASGRGGGRPQACSSSAQQAPKLLGAGGQRCVCGGGARAVLYPAAV